MKKTIKKKANLWKKDRSGNEPSGFVGLILVTLIIIVLLITSMKVFFPTMTNNLKNEAMALIGAQGVDNSGTPGYVQDEHGEWVYDPLYDNTQQPGYAPDVPEGYEGSWEWSDTEGKWTEVYGPNEPVTPDDDFT